jgi:hypothetical protein
MSREVKVYLHNDYEHSELQEVYDLNEEEAGKLYDALYEVAVIVDLDTGKLLRIAQSED